MKIQRGFSMIEVVITIAIMGILMAAAMPSIGDWISNTKVRSTAESIQNGLQRARMEAVRLNKPVTFYLVSDLGASCTLSATSGSWVVSQVSPVGQCNVAESATVTPMIVAKALVSDGGGGATISATQDGGTTTATSVTFNGFGQLANASSATAIRRILVTGTSNTAFSRRVEISLGGIGRLCDPAVTSTSDSRACTNIALTN
jgi:type IV fimbrial biogenesis protein FimT